MFYPYSLSDKPEQEKRELSALRAEMEPLVEIMQVKGDSECRNGLNGVVGGPDELCDFEKLRAPDELTEDCGDDVGQGGMMLSGCMSRFSYVRTALTQGLKEKDELGANPFKMGIIAATDNHTAAAGSVDEKDFHGSTGMDRFPERRLGPPVVVPGIAKGNTSRYNPGGLAGIWAEENSRESLFAAMKRKETFGTSGPRIKPRFFAGWEYPASACSSPMMIEEAYAKGVAMGGELPALPTANAKPSFIVSAIKDSAKGANNLQKLQVIKGWVGEDGQLQQKVIDVAGNSEADEKLDTSNCQPLTSGHANLCSVWRDEEFDSTQNAVYYARVVENPSCRWSVYDCNRFAEKDRPEACGLLPKEIQERAWTSPIWYEAL